ncbi:transcriptional regulator_gp055 [Bacillus phage vB_BceM_WH1]|nr:transcriptional regulator_gp055 [Bacillus phage vB_BceM_WH1]
MVVGRKMKDRTGEKFGMLTAIRYDGKDDRNNVKWHCECECGKTKTVLAKDLVSGHTKSCGCMKGSGAKLNKDGVGFSTKDLKGQRFGKLTVVEMGDRTIHGHLTWKCKCDCGTEKYIAGKYLRGGNTKSCGCLAREMSAVRVAAIAKKRFEKATGKKPEDHIGEAFNYFVVKGVSTKDNRTSWLVECGCGAERNIICHSLTSGKRQSCGCVANAHNLTDHQVRKLAINYLTAKWKMVTDAKQGNAWDNSFDIFADWAFETGYELGKHFMLTNIYRSYSPENCYWE